MTTNYLTTNFQSTAIYIWRRRNLGVLSERPTDGLCKAEGLGRVMRALNDGMNGKAVFAQRLVHGFGIWALFFGSFLEHCERERYVCTIWFMVILCAASDHFIGAEFDCVVMRVLEWSQWNRNSEGRCATAYGEDVLVVSKVCE